jgi:hypothetical protein
LSLRSFPSSSAVDLHEGRLGACPDHYMVGDVAAESFGQGVGAGQRRGEFSRPTFIALCLMNLLPIPA